MQRLLVALWVGIIPALLAGLVLRYLVPRAASAGLPGVVAALGHRFGLYLGVALFFLFSALVRYWRYWVPGGRYASALPAQLVPHETNGTRLAAWAGDASLYEGLRSGIRRQRLERTLSADKRAEVDRQLVAMRSGLEEGDANRTREARRVVEALAAPALAWNRRRDGLGLLAAVVLTGVVVIVLRDRVVEPYQVTSTSMLPTLEQDDRIAGRRVRYGISGLLPARGDVVVFSSGAVALGPRAGSVPEILVKRVVGLPGDRVAMRGASPIINGWRVPACDAGEYVYLMADSSGTSFQGVRGQLNVEFLDDRAYLTVYSAAAPSSDEYLVKPGEVFVLGDNRGNSLDSRSYNEGHGGGVPVDAMRARVQWFLVGTHRSGEPDFGRLMAPIDRLQARFRLEGFETDPLQSRIERCLQNRPRDTRPPPPGAPTAARESGT